MVILYKQRRQNRIVDYSDLVLGKIVDISYDVSNFASTSRYESEIGHLGFQVTTTRYIVGVIIPRSIHEQVPTMNLVNPQYFIGAKITRQDFFPENSNDGLNATSFLSEAYRVSDVPSCQNEYGDVIFGGDDCYVVRHIFETNRGRLNMDCVLDVLTDYDTFIVDAHTGEQVFL